MKIKTLFFIYGFGGGGAERSLIEIFKYYKRSKFNFKVKFHNRFNVNDYPNFVNENDVIDNNLLSFKVSYILNISLLIESFVLSFPYFKLNLISLYFKFFISKNLKRLKISNDLIDFIEKFYCIWYQEIFFLNRTVYEFKPNIIVGSLLESSNALIFLSKNTSMNCLKSVPWVTIQQSNASLTLEDSYLDTDFTNWISFSSLIFQSSEKIIAVSEGIKNDLIKKFNQNESKIDVIFNQVSCTDIDKAPKIQFPNKFISGAGRLVKQKQFDLLICAYFKICNYVQEDLLIFGKGICEKSLKELAFQLGIEKRVHFMGFSSDIWSYLKSSTLFILTSKYEGFPLILLEAMRCKTCVVSFDCESGPNEIIQNSITGVLIDNNDLNKLSETMLDLILDVNKREKIINNSFIHVLNFDSEKIASDYERLLNQIFHETDYNLH